MDGDYTRNQIAQLLQQYMQAQQKPEEYGWDAKFSMDGMDPTAPGFLERSRQNAQQGNTMGRAQPDPWDKDPWGDSGF